ncbi:MAG: aspartate aminotransferase family protein [Cyclonatronaceae bacterium]
MSTDFQELDSKHHFYLYRRYPVTLVRGEGSRVWDSDGNMYIDALAGIAVNSTGHCHPRVVKAVQEQAATLMHVSNFFTTPPQAELSRRLTGLSGLDRVFFCNSGLEAMEAAYKFSRKYGNNRGRQGDVLSMQGCFHGRSFSEIASGAAKYQDGFQPMPSGFRQLPFQDLNAIRAHIAGANAVVLEPVQGEGGVRPFDFNFLRDVRALCDEHDVLLIFDEIQCGIARTGRMFAWEHSGVKPDILTLAKALGGGLAIGAVVARQHVADAMEPGNHGTTFGGNPMACSAALANLDVIEEEDLVHRAAEFGGMIMQKIRDRASDEPAIKEVRGLGMMIGVELAFDGTGIPREMLRRGVISNCTAGNVMRIVPPLNISEEDMNTVIDVMFECIALERVKHHAETTGHNS